MTWTMLVICPLMAFSYELIPTFPEQILVPNLERLYLPELREPRGFMVGLGRRRHTYGQVRI